MRVARRFVDTRFTILIFPVRSLRSARARAPAQLNVTFILFNSTLTEALSLTHGKFSSSRRNQLKCKSNSAKLAAGRSWEFLSHRNTSSRHVYTLWEFLFLFCHVIHCYPLLQVLAQSAPFSLRLFNLETRGLRETAPKRIGGHAYKHYRRDDDSTPLARYPQITERI